MTHLLRIAGACTLFVLQGLAQAGVISVGPSSCHDGSLSLTTLTCDTKVDGVEHTATVSAWSAPGTGQFGQALLGYYGSYGMGIYGWDDWTHNNGHAVDNRHGTDAFLVNFGSLDVALNTISIGWKDKDADISVLRYTGTGAPSLGAYSVAGLKNARDWDWVGDFSTLAPNSPLNFNNSGEIKTASWWLVSAYNANYGGLAPTRHLDNGNDYFKLVSLGGNVVPVVTPPSSDVPEPGTFALFGVALLGLVAARRRLRTA